MQITGVFIFLFVWLIILWAGAIALEATGMERSKAFFQALSALSNTGFTTRQAEDIVEYPTTPPDCIVADFLRLRGDYGLSFPDDSLRQGWYSRALRNAYRDYRGVYGTSRYINLDRRYPITGERHFEAIP